MKPDFSTFCTWKPGVFVLKVLGFGVWIASYSEFRPLFSERNGYTKAYKIAPDWRLVFLAPWK
jgi:hypothetical protein